MLEWLKMKLDDYVQLYWVVKDCINEKGVRYSIEYDNKRYCCNSLVCSEDPKGDCPFAEYKTENRPLCHRQEYIGVKKQ